jgi:RNAse (barnase) inhibitor barstar
MTVTLELEFDSQILHEHTLADLYGRTLEARWKVVSHDISVPDEMPDGVDRIVHTIEKITFSPSYTHTIAWQKP